MVSQEVQDLASVLVVDDNPLIVNVLNSLLSSEKYRVYCSNNGKEALDILKRKEIDVIICDVMMPEMDGYDFHDYVRKKVELAHIPFVFLTALGEEEEVNKGREMGADDYIVKPFDPRSLLAVVKGKVARSRSIKLSSDSRYDTYRRRVIHTLSHEFRTPLVAINTGTELLMGQNESVDEAKVKHLIAAIHRGGQRLERLVNDFMLLQQIEAGIAQRLANNRAHRCNIGDTIAAFIDTKRERIQSQGFALNFDNMCQEIFVFVYEPFLVDILDRLISNSLKFSQEERVIEVCVYPCSGEVVTEIRDRGMGLDLDRVKEAIDIFGQIDRDKLEQQGGGLGLPIASRYAAICNGRLEFENRKGGGAVVSLLLPIVE